MHIYPCNNISTEMALHVLAYNMKRVMSILGSGRINESDPSIRSVLSATGCACQPQSAFLHSLGPKAEVLSPQNDVSFGWNSGHCSTRLMVNTVRSGATARRGAA